MKTELSKKKDALDKLEQENIAWMESETKLKAELEELSDQKEKWINKYEEEKLENSNILKDNQKLRSFVRDLSNEVSSLKSHLSSIDLDAIRRRCRF